jgi:hypothetical protein
MAVARQYKFALKVTREVKWDLPQDIVAAIRSYPSFLRLVKMDPHKITVPTIENGKTSFFFFFCYTRVSLIKKKSGG